MPAPRTIDHAEFSDAIAPLPVYRRELAWEYIRQFERAAVKAEKEKLELADKVIALESANKTQAENIVALVVAVNRLEGRR